MATSRQLRHLLTTVPKSYTRWYSTVTRLHPNDITTDSKTSKSLQNPESRRDRQIRLPPKIIKAAARIFEDRDIVAIAEGAETLCNQLWGRKPPAERHEIVKKAQEYERKLLGDSVDIMDDFTAVAVQHDVERIVLDQVRHATYLWKPMRYDSFGALAYLVGRSALDYACVRNIFQEIRFLDKTFTPKTVFDFGSGIGSVFWAVDDAWGKTFNEYFAVDVSKDMNELARLLLQGGDPTEPLRFKGFYQRQFLPKSSGIKHDLIVSAFSLLELPDMKTRLTTVINLWEKTSGMLVIVENGTLAGHRVVSEARDFILSLKEENGGKATVLAPCPHQGTCQRTSHPCSFPVRFQNPLPQVHRPVSANTIYSYVVLQRSPIKPKITEHPRIIEPVLCRGRHVVCRACCPDGVVREKIFTREKDRADNIYKMVRKSRWGDSLPLDMNFPVE